jgi:hypothetical protein
MAETDKDKANMLIGTFYPILPESRLGHKSRQGAEKVATSKTPKELPLITEEEIRHAIFRFNPKKALGADEITFEM